MRIVVEPGDLILRNAGEMAMLEVALSRLVSMWPDAQVRVFSYMPETFPHYGKNVLPVSALGRSRWLETQAPRRAGLLRFAISRTAGKIAEAVGFGRGLEEREFVDLVSTADLIIATGMGGITDAFPDYAADVLSTFALGLRHDAVTAMLGQGIGPLANGSLRRRARAVLPGIDLIGLREGIAGPQILKALGVQSSRVMVTGDDAIELAYMSHPAQLGDGIGINLRAATYSGLAARQIAAVRAELHGCAERLAAPVIPVPISWVPGEEDADTIRQLLKGHDDASDGGSGIRSVAGVLEQVRQCRVVVTGSYHAAVFALAQGIPAVGIAGSPYYLQKFTGLADQFRTGCEVLTTRDVESQGSVGAAVETRWRRAPEYRAALLEDAVRQIDSSRNAYRRLFHMLEDRP